MTSRSFSTRALWWARLDTWWTSLPAANRVVITALGPLTAGIVVIIVASPYLGADAREMAVKALTVLKVVCSLTIAGIAIAYFVKKIWLP